MSPFEFVKAINNKTDIMRDDLDEKAYNSYMINRSFSYFPDTVLLANEMNIYQNLVSKLQNDFFLNTIRKNPKRFGREGGREERESERRERTVNASTTWLKVHTEVCYFRAQARGGCS